MSRAEFYSDLLDTYRRRAEEEDRAAEHHRESASLFRAEIDRLSKELVADGTLTAAEEEDR